MMPNRLELPSRISVKSKDSNYDRKYEIKSEEDFLKAATVGDFKTVQELLESGVSVETEELHKFLRYKFKNYTTPLQIAAANGHEKCIKILLDYGANVNAKDTFNATALHIAAEKGHYFYIKSLLEAGADCCMPTKFSNWPFITQAPYRQGTTPLHLAASNNNVNCVKELIQYGVDYNAVDDYGRTSLYIAAEAGFYNCVLSHLKNATGKKIPSIPSFHTSDIPLHFAVAYNMVDCVKELLNIGSDLPIEQLTCYQT